MSNKNLPLANRYTRTNPNPAFATRYTRTAQDQPFFTTAPSVGTSVHLPADPHFATFVDCDAFPFGDYEWLPSALQKGDLYGTIVNNPTAEPLTDEEVVVKFNGITHVVLVSWAYLQAVKSEIKKKEEVVIFDLDGTLSNNQHRLYLIDHEDTTQWHWDHYTKQCVFDVPNTKIIERLKQYQHQGKKIIILTGRCESMLEQTKAWLSGAGVNLTDASNGLDNGYRLHMRPKSNRQPDVDLKRQWLSAYLKADAISASTTVAYDDLEHNAKMFKEQGLLTYLVSGNTVKKY